MNWKEFLKPDWRKIVIFVIAFGLIGFLISPSIHPIPTDMPIFKGFPLPFYKPEFRWGPQYSPEKFYFFPLILDVIFYYLLSCLIVWIYDKVKKK